jgi:hypothetical protein
MYLEIIFNLQKKYTFPFSTFSTENNFMKLQPLLFLAGSLLAFSCSKYDRLPPKIEFINISGQTSGIELTAGNQYALDYRIEDNKKIRLVQINARKGFRSEQNVYVNSKDFTYANGFDPDNSVKQEPIRFPIPATSRAGSYRITINAKDGNGNMPSERTLNFVINHPDAPYVGLNIKTTFNDLVPPVFDVKRADRIEISGTATDATDITMVKVDLVGENTSLFSNVFDVPGTADTSIDIAQVIGSYVFRVPATAETGPYDLMISVTSKSGHTTVKTYRLNVMF